MFVKNRTFIYSSLTVKKFVFIEDTCKVDASNLGLNRSRGKLSYRHVISGSIGTNEKSEEKWEA